MAYSQFRLASKYRIFWHKLITLELAGADNTQMAKLLGCSDGKIEKHLQYPAYLELKAAKLQRRESAFDREFSKSTERMLEGMRELVPLTLRVYEEAMQKGLTDPRYLQAAVKAADSVNDRVGMLRESRQVHELTVAPADLERARSVAQRLRSHVRSMNSETLPQLKEHRQEIGAQLADTIDVEPIYGEQDSSSTTTDSVDDVTSTQE